MATTLRARLNDDDGFGTVPQSMRELGVSRSRLLALIIRGDLTAKQVAGQLFVDRNSILAYKTKVTTK